MPIELIFEILKISLTITPLDENIMAEIRQIITPNKN
jgi:hypothetical protein